MLSPIHEPDCIIIQQLESQAQLSEGHAALLKVSTKTVYNRVKKNTLPHAKLGRKLLFHKQSLVQWVAKGGDRAHSGSDSEPLTLDRLTGMLNNGQARIASTRS